MAIFGSGLGKNKWVKGGVHPGISIIVLIASFVRAFAERLPELRICPFRVFVLSDSEQRVL